MGIIFYLSTTHNPPTPLTFDGSDKLEHALFYFMLGVLLWRAFHATWQRRVALASVAVGFLYGVAIELYQSRLEYRSCEWGDAVANAMGVAVGVATCSRICYQRAKITTSNRG
jgi:VanZ family protein